jgi:putative colanic acid biosynthesis UDP-glucose lipid carrier transferase
LATAPSPPLLVRRPISKALVWDEAQSDARALGHRVDPHRLLGGLIGFAEALLIVLAGAGAYIIRNGIEKVPTETEAMLGIAAIATVSMLYFSRSYSENVTDPWTHQIAKVAKVWTGVCIGLVLVIYFTKTTTDFSRVWAVIWYGSALLLLIGARGVASLWIKRARARGRLATTVAIVDLGGYGDALASKLRRSRPDEVHLAGVFRLCPPPTAADGIGDLITLSHRFRIDEVLVVTPSDIDEDISPVLRRLSSMASNIRLCPPIPELAAAPIIGSGMMFGLLAATIYRKPLNGWNSVAKRAEDLVLSSLALFLLLPLMLLVAVCVKLESPGPALFRQRRQGFNNNVFIVYKFRTMTHSEQSETDVPQAKRGDYRITRFGRILRRTSLDELPQLLNVLRGEMSLVGPRPHAVAHNDMYSALIDNYIGRHRVQPGITGWAQVNGLRGETDTLDKMQRRVIYDLAYIDQWSMLFDIRIMVATVFKAPFQRQAY